MDAATQAIQAVAFNFVGPQVSVGIQTVIEGPGGGFFGHGLHKRVIVIQDGNPARGSWQRLHQFSLAFGDIFHGAGTFRVDGTDIGHDADFGPGDIAKQLDVAGNIKTHFQHGDFMILV